MSTPYLIRGLRKRRAYLRDNSTLRSTPGGPIAPLRRHTGRTPYYVDLCRDEISRCTALGSAIRQLHRTKACYGVRVAGTKLELGEMANKDSVRGNEAQGQGKESSQYRDISRKWLAREKSLKLFLIGYCSINHIDVLKIFPPREVLCG